MKKLLVILSVLTSLLLVSCCGGSCDKEEGSCKDKKECCSKDKEKCKEECKKKCEKGDKKCEKGDKKECCHKKKDSTTTEATPALESEVEEVTETEVAE